MRGLSYFVAKAIGSYAARMTRLVQKHPVETFLIVLTLTASLIELLVLNDKNLGVLILVLGSMFSASVLLLRTHIRDLLADNIDRVVVDVPRPWQDDALDAKARLQAELREWAGGHRRLKNRDGIDYQIEALGRVKHRIDAIHLALDRKDAYRWDRKEGRFSALIDAHEKLGPPVQKRRIFIFDDGDSDLVEAVDGRRVIQDEVVVRICRRQLATTDGGLGVDLRVLWKSEIAEKQLDPPQDLLMIDGAEAIDVKVLAGDTEGVDIYETDVYVDSSYVHEYEREFIAYWNSATPAAEFLPSEPQANGQESGRAQVDERTNDARRDTPAERVGG